MRTIHLISLFAATAAATAQPALPDLFHQNGDVELGLNERGTLISDGAPPAGYHPTNFDDRLGLVYDAADNDFGGPYCGDFFAPGSPIEQFAVAIGDGDVLINSSTIFAPFFDIPGGHTDWWDASAFQASGWVGQVTPTLRLEQTVVSFKKQAAPIALVKVRFCNAGTAPVSDVYYGRNWDPDPDQALAGSFVTEHEVLRQPPLFTDAAIVARGVGVSCLVGAVSKDSRARVSYGSFLAGDPRDMWHGSGFYNPSGGNLADEANQISFRIDEVPAGGCECLAFAWFFDEDDFLVARKAASMACGVFGHEPSSRRGDFDALAAALDDPESDALTAWPNPAREGIYLHPGEGEVSLRILDAAGRTVHAETGVEGVQRISTRGWAPGLYLIRVEGGAGPRTGKVVVR